MDFLYSETVDDFPYLDCVKEFKMDLQEALQNAGGFGRYQLIHVICILITSYSPVIWNNLSIVFQGKTMYFLHHNIDKVFWLC